MTFLYHQRPQVLKLNCHEKDSDENFLYRNMQSQAQIHKMKTHIGSEGNYGANMINKKSLPTIPPYNVETYRCSHLRVNEERKNLDTSLELSRKLPDSSSKTYTFSKKKDYSHTNRIKPSIVDFKSRSGSSSSIEMTPSELHHWTKQSNAGNDRKKQHANMKEAYNSEMQMMLEQGPKWNWTVDRPDVSENMNDLLFHQMTMLDQYHSSHQLSSGATCMVNSPDSSQREKGGPILNTLKMELMESCIPSVKLNLAMPEPSMESNHPRDRNACEPGSSVGTNSMPHGITKNSKVIIQCSMETIRPCGAQHLIYSNKPNTVRWFSLHVSNLPAKKSSKMLNPSSIPVNMQNQMYPSSNKQSAYNTPSNLHSQSVDPQYHPMTLRNQQIEAWPNESSMPADLGWSHDAFYGRDETRTAPGKYAAHHQHKGGLSPQTYEEQYLSMMFMHPNEIYYSNVAANQNHAMPYTTSTHLLPLNLSENSNYKLQQHHFLADADKYKLSQSNMKGGKHYNDMIENQAETIWIKTEGSNNGMPYMNHKSAY